MVLLSLTARPKNLGGGNPLVLTFVRKKIGLVLCYPPSVIHNATCIRRLTSLYLFKACKHFWRHKSCVKEITFARCHNVWRLGCVFICFGSVSGSQSLPECIVKASEVLLMMLACPDWNTPCIQQMSGQIKASGEDAAEVVILHDQLWHKTSDGPDQAS